MQMSLKSDLIRHQVFLQRLVKSEVNALVPTLVRARVIAQDMIDKGMTRRTIEQQIYEIMKLLNDLVITNMSEIVDYETRFTYKLLLKHLDQGKIDELKKPEPKPIAKIKKEVAKAPVNLVTNQEPMSIEKTIDTFAKKKSKQMALIITDAEVKKEEPSVTKALIAGFITGLVLVQTRSLVSTLINKASELAKEEVFQDNKSLVGNVIWSTELDDAVCEDCEALEGTELSVEDFTDLCPLHSNCRCFATPVL